MAVMSALPQSEPAFKRDDPVRVIRQGADQGMTGVVVRVMSKHDEYLVEFNGVDQQIYRERDLELNPRVAVKIPMA